MQIRPIDKKLQYQIQKLMKVTTNPEKKSGSTEKEADTNQKTEDLLKYRPNPDLLVSKINTTSEASLLYRKRFFWGYNTMLERKLIIVISHFVIRVK